MYLLSWFEKDDALMQLDQPQGKLMQNKERQSVLAFLEYIQAFQVTIDDKSYLIPFDTGDYSPGAGISEALVHLAGMLNESLRKKTSAHTGRRAMAHKDIERFLFVISAYLGVSNLAVFPHKEEMSSLTALLHGRSGGLLEPLTDKEWQALSDKAVACMLERWQRETETNFTADGDWISYRGSAKKYKFANNEAKRAAEAIVSAEKVRLTLFLDALQGTLRFLDRVTRLPNYTERQIPKEDRERYSYDIQKDARGVASGIISIFQAFLDEDTKKQEVTAQNDATIVVKRKVTLPTSVTLQVRKEEHTGDLHTYHLTLTDSRHLSEPVQFLLQVSESGEAELFEDDSNG